MQRWSTLRAGTHGLWWDNPLGGALFPIHSDVSRIWSKGYQTTMPCYQSQLWLCSYCVWCWFWAMPCYVTFLRDAAVVDESAAGQYIRTPSRNLENWISTTYSHALTHLFTHFPGLSLTLSLSSTCSPCAIYSFTLISTLSLTHINTHSRLITHRDTRSLFLTLSLSHTHAFVHPRSHPLTNHSPIHPF